jgi:Carbohydrate binding module (family 6)/F5/8 type C domain
VQLVSPFFESDFKRYSYICSWVHVGVFALVLAISSITAVPQAGSTNVALNKSATQSSTYVGAGGAVPSLAVDGNTSGAWSDGSVTHTNGGNQEWWQVDFGASYSLQTINVWNRTDCCGDRLSNFYVLVSDNPFASTDLTATLNQSGVSNYYTAGQGGTPTTLNINRTGRYVRVQLAGWGILSLAEVEAFGTAGGGDSDGVLAAPRNTPFNGTRISIPGTIESENFDNGGADVGYHDTSPGSHGQDYNNPPNYPPPEYRQPTDVDIYKSASGYSNGYLVVLQAGDWMNYSVNVPQAGYYALDARVAWGGGPGGNFHLEVDGLDVTGAVQIPDSSWGLTTITRSGLQLPAGNHTMRVVADTNGTYGYTGDIDYLRFTFDNSLFAGGGSPTTIPVHIDFDQLGGNPIPNLTPIGDQWLQAAGVRFYSNNLAKPLHISQNCSESCLTTSLPNFITTKPDDGGVMNAEFTIPVSNLTFYMIGVDAFFFNQFAVVDVYRGSSLYASYPILGNGTSTVGFTFGALDNISKIVVRNINDPLGIGFDDFFFNVPVNVTIRNPRTTEALNGTTRNALLGADIALNTSVTPGAVAGGTYRWTLSGPVAISGGSQNGPSITIRSTEVSSEPGAGPIVATVTYTNGNIASSALVTINSILPTLTEITAIQRAHQITPPFGCDHGFPYSIFWFYDLGCYPNTAGISFNSRVHVPDFISDSTQSGIKYVQGVSAFRKEMSRGVRCSTKRSAEDDVASGWQLDTEDPVTCCHLFTVQYFSLLEVVPFSPGHEMQIGVEDYPSQELTGLADYRFIDSLYVDDKFQMYLIYFTGPDPSHPPIKRPLGKVAWNWGGLVVFDWDSNLQDAIHKIRTTNVAPHTIVGDIFPPSMQKMSSLVNMQTNVTDLPKDGSQCPNGPALTNNRIDSAREFVKYHYIDFLSRTPYGDQNAEPPYPPDPKGWNYWTTAISQCVFDLDCAHVQRVNTGFAFFRSDEFLRLVTPVDPIMANGPGTPNYDPPTYNRRFIYWMYKIYLQKAPDDVGWDFWTNDLNAKNNYWHIVDAFQVCSDYRDHRQFQ